VVKACWLARRTLPCLISPKLSESMLPSIVAMLAAYRGDENYPFFAVTQGIYHTLAIEKGSVCCYSGIAEVVVEHTKIWLESR